MAGTRYNYTGGVTQITLQPGRYLLEAFGAGGGNDGTRRGGTGGYSKGELLLTTARTLFLCPGGAGTTGTNASGGYNGGGRSGGLGSSGSGGGATHISMGNINRGILASHEAAKNEVLLVAGGGGGAGTNGDGGHGGGTNGGANNAGKISGQSTGYSFGIGEDRVQAGGSVSTGSLSGTASYISRHNGASYYTTVATITITSNGTLNFWSTSSSANSHQSDPYGYIYKNGNLLASNDDGGVGYNFSMSVSVSIGDIITLKIAGYSSSGSTPWQCTYPKSPPVSGGGGGGGWFGGYCASVDAGGGGGSGYANTSVLTNTSLNNARGAASNSHGYIIITKIDYKILFSFDKCKGSSSELYSNGITSITVDTIGQTYKEGQNVFVFQNWSLPSSSYIQFVKINNMKYRIDLKVDTTTLSGNVTYTIKANYKRSYNIILVFENCIGTASILNSYDVKTSTVTNKGKKTVLNGIISSFIGWIMPKTKHLLFDVKTPDQYEITINVDSLMLTQDETYTIRAIYEKGRLNSNLYKNSISQSIFDFIRLIES